MWFVLCNVHYIFLFYIAVNFFTMMKHKKLVNLLHCVEVLSTSSSFSFSRSFYSRGFSVVYVVWQPIHRFEFLSFHVYPLVFISLVVEDIFKRREPMPSMDAIYFVQPSKEKYVHTIHIIFYLYFKWKFLYDIFHISWNHTIDW